MSLDCWQCGRDLSDVLLPLVRSSVCPACEADLHVCRMCTFFSPGHARSCAEPVAEEVRDKTRSNFCDYFRAREGAHAGSEAADAARAGLDALFGLPSGAAGDPGGAEDPAEMERRKREQADDAQDELRRLFGIDDDR